MDADARAAGEREQAGAGRDGPRRLPMATAAAAPPPPPVRVAALAELERIYRDVDAEIARHRPRCEQRGICCDFERADHVLYASNLEIAYIEHTVAPERYRAATPTRCPFLHEGRCTARSQRMLGCRTYFCQPGWEPVGAEIHERALRRIQAVLQRHGLPWRYAPALEQLRSGCGLAFD